MTDLFQTPPKRQKRLIWSSSPSSGGSAPTSDERVVLRFQLPDVNNRAKRVDYSLTKSQFKDVTPDKSPKHAVWEEKFFRRIEIIGTCHLQIKSKYDICTAYSEGRTGIACSWAQKTDNSGSLVNLKSHLTSCHKSIVNGMTSPQKKAIFGEVKTQTKLGSDVALKIDDNFKMSPMAVKEAIGKHIILDMAPLSVSENRGFREMMADLRPDLKLPVRSTMTLCA
ncbi:hypothetical protein BCR33DRAFT_72580 [Rhizoclosmatium globosum]|uniref:Uncharacterized protein n=1 Tax=Rhizoclosmatium globosum TaxID=329046 RepID=A0A1Y2ATI7_9FUNG|nr:hypothetical protein BCR33DRAFT_72580 [Rhizoclosmatium globosum]|eukprot:ORY25610.1 hypothetical protein BCR33DRAFT_72580 [Rhizoclosmatium globosum]